MNSHSQLACYRCGASLAALSLPIRRHDQCPKCSVFLQVCRMCSSYAPHVPRQCTEDDAEEVLDKERQNFCEWFTPSPGAFDARRAAGDSRAQQELAALFGDTEAAGDSGTESSAAEDLFK